MKYSFFIIKPDAFEENKVFDVLKLIKENGFSFYILKEIKLNKYLLSKHYEEHVNKPFYNELIEFMLSSNVLVGIIYSETNTVENFKILVGSTKPKEAKKFTIRNIFGYQQRKNKKINYVMRNIIHASSDMVNAKREIINFKSMFFSISKDLENFLKSDV